MQHSSWADRLELVGDDDRLVGFAGALPLRLLAERTGLRTGLSTAMTRRGFTPVYDRGQLLVDLAVIQLLGGEAISDFQGLRHLAPVIGPIPSTPTVWRAMAEVGELQLARINTAVTAFRRTGGGCWPPAPRVPLAAGGRAGADRDHRGGPGRLDRVRRSDKENAAPTYKGGIGFCPNLASCDNTDDVLVIDPRPGNATSNDAADNIALLDRAVERLPGRYRRRMLIRLDGAGFSHELLEHIAAGGQVKGRNWEFSAGWSCTDREIDAIAALPDDAWTAAIEQDGEPVDNAYVAELTGLLDLQAWQQKIPGLRVLVRDEPLHPRYRKRATDREKALGRRYQLIVTNTKVGQIAWLDARHRSHVHVENDVKQAKDLGLNNWPSRFWTINVTWTQIIALAANLLACYRQLALPEGDLRDAAPKLLRYRLWQLPARLTRGQRKQWLHLRADWPWTTDVINTWQAVKALPAPP